MPASLAGRGRALVGKKSDRSHFRQDPLKLCLSAAEETNHQAHASFQIKSAEVIFNRLSTFAQAFLSNCFSVIMRLFFKQSYCLRLPKFWNCVSGNAFVCLGECKFRHLCNEWSNLSDKLVLLMMVFTFYLNSRLGCFNYLSPLFVMKWRTYAAISVQTSQFKTHKLLSYYIILWDFWPWLIILNITYK